MKNMYVCNVGTPEEPLTIPVMDFQKDPVTGLVVPRPPVRVGKDEPASNQQAASTGDEEAPLMLPIMRFDKE